LGPDIAVLFAQAAKEALARTQQTGKAQRPSAPQLSSQPPAAALEAAATQRQRPKSAGATRSAKYTTQEFISQAGMFLP